MSYIKYDELGVLEICCMNCGKPVATRGIKQVKIKSIPPKELNVTVMKRLSSWRRKKYILDDGSFMDIILCDECEELDIDPAKIESAIEKGWEMELKQENKTHKEVSDYIKKLPKIERNKDKIQEHKEANMRKV